MLDLYKMKNLYYEEKRKINDITLTDMTVHEKELRCKLICLMRALDLYNCTDIYNNCLSCKCKENEMLINPIGQYPNETSASHLTKCDYNSKILSGGSVFNCKASKLHGAIYKNNPLINVIIHVRCSWSLVISSTDISILPLNDDIDKIGDLSRYTLPTNSDIPYDKINDIIHQNKIMVIENNGMLFMGNTFDDLFSLFYRTMKLIELTICIRKLNYNNNLNVHNYKQSCALTDETLPTLESYLFDAHVRFLERCGHNTGFYKSHTNDHFEDINLNNKFNDRLLRDSGLGTLSLNYEDSRTPDDNIEMFNSNNDIQVEQIPSSESSRELYLKKSFVISETSEDIDRNSDIVNNTEIPRRKKLKSFMRRSKSLTSGVEKAIFRKYSEKIFTENQS